MGIGGVWHWVILLLIIALVFGTKKLRNVGEDLGAAIKGFKKGMTDGDSDPQRLKADPAAQDAPAAANKAERVD